MVDRRPDRLSGNSEHATVSFRRLYAGGYQRPDVHGLCPRAGLGQWGVWRACAIRVGWRASAIRGQVVSPYLQLLGGTLTHVSALISLKLSSRSMG